MTVQRPSRRRTTNVRGSRSASPFQCSAPTFLPSPLLGRGVGGEGWSRGTPLPLTPNPSPPITGERGEEPISPMRSFLARRWFLLLVAGGLAFSILPPDAVRWVVEPFKPKVVVAARI